MYPDLFTECTLFLTEVLSDSRGYLVDEDGFDYMKVQFLRDIKAQHRSLRLVSHPSFIYVSCWQLYMI